jgi:hypothetical protein
VVYKITKLARQNSDPSLISLRSSTGLLLFRGESSLIELSVLMASIICFSKAILVNKKDLKRFRRTQKTVFDLNVYHNRIYICYK